MTEADVANAIVRHGGVFSRRQWAVVPNVSWGWGLNYEADVIAVSAAGRVNEVEIKISIHDLKQDLKKNKWRHPLDKRIHKFWYGVPEDMANAAMGIALPFGVEQGVIAIYPPEPAPYDFFSAKIIRGAKPIRDAVKATPEQISELYRLGNLRYWDQRLKSSEK